MGKWDKYIASDDQTASSSPPSKWDQYVVDSVETQNEFKGTGNQVIDSFLMAGNEAKRGFFRGGAAAVSPIATLLKIGQVPEKYNAFEQSRQLYDRYAEEVPQSKMNPLAQFIYEGIGSAPGQVVAWEQTGGPLLKLGGKAFGAGKSLIGKIGKSLEPKVPVLEAQKSILDSQLENTKVLNDIQSTTLASEISERMASDKIRIGNNIKDVSSKIKSAADSTTKNARNVVMDYWNELKTNFGKDYTQAAKGLKITPTQELDALNKGAMESGIFNKIESGSPLNSAEKKIMSMIDSAQGRIGSSELNVARPLEHFDQEIHSLSKEYGGDHTVTAIRKNVADILEGLKTVRAKWRTPYQLKNEMFKIFQPFNKSGEFDTTSGVNLLNRVFNSTGKANPDEIRLVQELEKRSPKLFSQLKSLQSAKNNLVSNLTTVKETGVNNIKQLMEDSYKATSDALIEHKNASDLLNSLITKAKSKDAKNLMIKGLISSGAKGAATVVGGGALYGVGKAVHDILNTN